MKFGDGVPRWARRRVERHLARHGDGKLIRWMTFAPEKRQAGAAAADAASNVVPFIRRPPAAEPGFTAQSLDATGS
ncbi:hypothetical protein VQ02_18400 [Methylobacterium variabile]|jgi:hypothetical protein|uniref:Uncharacterized protein n=1 Tax=Methylobacterium variabile TaxID=298794 RepID=A0A0J6V7C9_9HYPH|nr:hypothetical protein [Methylobacterium variabile]KMO34846.1 hypothetical protein VQ02_18400 [Methylobacterium variabile]